MLPCRSTIKPLSDVSLHKTGSRPASHDGEAEDGGLAAMVPSLTVPPLDIDGGDCRRRSPPRRSSITTTPG